MKLTMKRFLMFAVTFFFVMSISINVFADTAESARNLFYTGNNINKTVDGKSDVYMAGNTISLNGTVEGDVIVAGNTINIDVNSIGGSVRAAANVININSQINRNITAFANAININSNSKAKGVYVFAESVNLLGEVEDLYIVASKVELNGVVTGNAKIICDELIIAENARVDGSFDVKAENEPTVLGSFNTSKINFEKIETDNKDNSFLGSTIIGGFLGAALIGKIVSLITAIILVLLISVLCKKYLSNSYDRLVNKPWLPFLIGFATLIIVPILSMMLCFTVVCIPISIISILIYSVLIYIAPIISGIVIGRIVFRNMNKYLSAIVFTLIIKLITFIPFIGVIAGLACLLLSLGLFIQNIFAILTEKQA